MKNEENTSTIYSNIVLLHEDERCGKPSAINLILSNKLAPILVFIAADNIPSKGSIDKLINKFQDEKVGGVNGHPVPVKGFRKNEIIWKLHHHYMIYEDITNKLQHFTGEFCAFRPIFSEIPLDVINDDVWMAIQIKENGFNISYEPEATSYFQSPSNIFEYIKQRTRIVYGHDQVPQRTLLSTAVSEPIYTMKIIIAALRELSFIRILYTLFLELYIVLKSKFYQKGVVWDKVECKAE